LPVARSGRRVDRGTARCGGVAIARAAIREGIETLPVAQLAGPELDVRLLVDHRERLVGQRTALINDLRWGRTICGQSSRSRRGR
jgi:transposase